MIPPSPPDTLRDGTRVVRATVSAALLLLVVLTLVFAAFSVLPSDPVRNALGLNVSEVAVAAARHELGLDRPLLTRYAAFLRGAATAQFGHSVYTHQEVRPMVMAAATVTARNGALALLAAMLGSLALISVAALHRGRTRELVTTSARIVTSVPSVVVALCAGVAVYGILGGAIDPGTRGAMAVILAVAMYPLGSLTEIGIAEARRVEEAAFVTASRAMGHAERTIFFRVTLRIILTAWGGQLSNLLATLLVSSAVFEAVSSVPGIGDLLARSVLANDLPVVQAIAVFVVVGFLTIDLLFGRLLVPSMGIYQQGRE